MMSFKRQDIYLLLCIGLAGIGYLLLIGQTQSASGQIDGDELVYLPMIMEGEASTSPGPISTHTPEPEPSATPTPGLDPNFLFLETFDGEPTSPQRWTDPNWEITIHQRDQDRLYEMLPMEAQHGPNCEAPSETHTITAFEDNLYICRNHMMTANYGISDNGGYGMVYFTPNRTLDTTGDFFIQFDMSTYRVNPVRNWVDVWITPYDKNLQLTLNDWLPDVQGPATEAIQFHFIQENQFQIKFHENGTETVLELEDFTPMEDVLELSKSVRTTVYIGVENGRLKVGLPQHDLWWYDRNVPEMLTRSHWNETVVQFGHHSYTPHKLCELSPNPAECETLQADTFHWDNMSLYPGTPFDMVHGSPRLVTGTIGNQTFTAEEPAPANAYLRFGGIGLNLEVSFDGGSSWQAAELQEHTYHYQYDDGHFSSYWMPVPEGTTTVQFRGDDWWAGEWAARDITFWAKGNDSSQQLMQASNLQTESEWAALEAFINGDRDPNSYFCAIP
ncbi:MAG: hypothetical protein AAF633_08945 [Chloroflexota bacterium]